MTSIPEETVAELLNLYTSTITECDNKFRVHSRQLIATPYSTFKVDKYKVLLQNFAINRLIQKIMSTSIRALFQQRAPY